MIRFRARTTLALALGLGAAAGTAVAQQPDLGWRSVDYGRVVDGRELTHSGEPVELLLGRLGGRPLPAPGAGRPADRLDHVLLDSPLEKYTFLLADVLDSRAGGSVERIEVGGLWDPGEAQPAWVELVRSGRYVVESDGRGNLRAILPWEGDTLRDSRGLPLIAADRAAEQAWRAAWPVLRHLHAGELARLKRGGGAAALSVQVHAYRHLPARSSFLLGVRGITLPVDAGSLGSAGAGFDPAAFLLLEQRKLRFEGGRLEADGRIRLVGSPADEGASLRAPSAADLAVAYRAVFHGGLSEPYMSLDRGPYPHTSVVNYGGRLRDTRLGWVSLLCDLRLKTFSMGYGTYEGRDLRPELRERLSRFRTHIERFAEHPDSRSVFSQQTRLWFYPDSVELTVSPDAGSMLLQRVRMAAASERVAEGTLTGTAEGAQPPWTRATIDAINEHYDVLARRFPELADLDDAVRWLALFTWLQEAGARGNLLPDLSSLLATTLPATPTPRRFPQLLSFNVLPPAGQGGAVDVLERVALAEALERRAPSWWGRPDARTRFTLARDALKDGEPQQAELRRQLAGVDPSQLPPSVLDLQSYRAERLQMHDAVLRSLSQDDRDRLAGAHSAGQSRVFSLAIGGIDLSMRGAIGRGGSSNIGLAGSGVVRSAGARPPAAARRTAATVTAAAPPVVEDPVVELPAHGGAGDSAWIRVAARDGGGSTVETVWHAWSPEVRYRKIDLDTDGRPQAFTRGFGPLRLEFRVRWDGTAARLEPLPADAGGGPDVADDGPPALPDGLAALEPTGLRTANAGTLHERSEFGLRLAAGAGDEQVERTAGLPLATVRALLLGPSASPEGEALPSALRRLPKALGSVETLMAFAPADHALPPWESPALVRRAEEDPLKIAAALEDWRVAGFVDYPVVIGTDRAKAPDRWASAPDRGQGLLVLPDGAFPPPFEALAGELRESWSGGRVLAEAAPTKGERLVVMVSSESPGVCAERLLRMARTKVMRGRYLAGWCLGGPIRNDLPARLMREGQLAAVGLAGESIVGRRTAAARLAAFAAALAGDGQARRVEALPGPFRWYY